MQIYETNSRLGYRQRAYLIKISEGAYLCIGTTMHVTEYYVGGMTYDMEDYEIQESKWDIKESELYGSFMLDYVMKALDDCRLTIVGADKPRDLDGLCWACSTTGR